MARSSRRDDEDALDPVEAADVDAEDPDEADGFSETEDDEAFGSDDLASDELDDDTIEGADPDDASEELLEDDVPPVEVALPEGTGFDDDEVIAAVAVDEDDLEDDDVDGLREGEFVCRSCHMAKRDTQLADPERLLCRDCA